MNVKRTVEERGKRYGKFSDNAKLVNKLRGLLLGNIEDPVIYEGLVHICQKLARIASGDPGYIDNFRDIGGYAERIMEYLENEADEATDAEIRIKRKVHGKWVFD